MSCTDECVTDKTEAREFAFFAGVERGRRSERSAIIAKLRAKREAMMTGIRVLDEVIELILEKQNEQ